MIWTKPDANPSYYKAADGIYRVITGRDVSVITYIDFMDGNEFVRIQRYHSSNEDTAESFQPRKGLRRIPKESYDLTVSNIQKIL
jgi:hypothetical protein